ncbi:MAG: response regulator transcription factor [Verrucomicrobia bacterium]|nr:response regulator transcription factor [Verrucomicrobiota bacterium]
MLIADDSPVMLRILAQILEAEGYFTLVGSVTDGSQAVRQTLNLKPELVLMDYSMPRMNGINATRCIKQVQDPPFVIIITSNDTPACKTLTEAAGADGFVLKGERPAPPVAHGPPGFVSVLDEDLASPRWFRIRRGWQHEQSRQTRRPRPMS